MSNPIPYFFACEVDPAAEGVFVGVAGPQAGELNCIHIPFEQIDNVIEKLGCVSQQGVYMGHSDPQYDRIYIPVEHIDNVIEKLDLVKKHCLEIRKKLDSLQQEMALFIEATLSNKVAQ